MPDSERYAEALAELTGVAPADFVARRRAIAAELRKAGDRETAARLLAIRKPATVVAAANQVARFDPEATEQLLHLGDLLERAQREALSGRSAAADLRSASAAFQQAVDNVARHAPGSDVARRQLRDLVSAAALGPPEFRDALRRGVLLEEPPPVGFGGISGLSDTPGPPARRGPKASPPAPPGGGSASPPAPPRKPARDLEAERNAARLVAARDRARRAVEAAEQADAHARRLEEEASRAEGDAARLRREAERARRTAEGKQAAADGLRAELPD